METEKSIPADGKPASFSTQRILLEVITFFYFVGKNSIIPLAQQSVHQMVANRYNYTEATNNNTDFCGVLDMDQAQLSSRVDDESNLIILYLTIAELLPSVFVVLGLGLYSDMTGKRKFLMWLPCLGNALYALGLLVSYYIYGSEYNMGSLVITLTFTTMCGLSGNISAFFAGNAAFISDTDSRERRTSRLAIVEFTVGMTFGITNLFLGYWIRDAGFVPPLWFVFACSVLPMFLVIFFLEEPLNSAPIRKPTTKAICSFGDICSCSTIPMRKLWAMFFAFQLYVFVQQGQERTFIPFLEQAPFCWDSVKIGGFLFVLYFLSGLGSWPGVPLMKRCVGDVTIFIVAIISKGLGSILLSIANSSVLVYVSCVAQIFHLTPFAVGRSLVSQQVGPDKQGMVYGLLHSAQSIVGFAGPAVHTAIFAATTADMSGAVFLLSATLLIIPLILLGYIKFLERRDQNESTVYDGIESANDFEILSETTSLVQGY